MTIALLEKSHQRVYQVSELIKISSFKAETLYEPLHASLPLKQNKSSLLTIRSIRFCNSHIHLSNGCMYTYRTQVFYCTLNPLAAHQ